MAQPAQHTLPQKTYEHRHSKPVRPTFLLQVKQRVRFFCTGRAGDSAGAALPAAATPPPLAGVSSRTSAGTAAAAGAAAGARTGVAGTDTTPTGASTGAVPGAGAGAATGAATLGRHDAGSAAIPTRANQTRRRSAPQRARSTTQKYKNGCVIAGGRRSRGSSSGAEGG
jgi:hypothetical protein